MQHPWRVFSDENYYASFVILAVFTMNTAVCWDLIPYELVESYCVLEEHATSVFRVGDGGRIWLCRAGVYKFFNS
jgi:hypothetical protein